MPPISDVTCPPISNVTFSNSSEGPRNFGKDDLDALLYIVVTLLFYSMGIIIGIITYLKREQAEMEEDKLFDTYMEIRREPVNMQKKERVRKMALYLKQIEEQKAVREKGDGWKESASKQPHPQLQQHRQSCCRCIPQGSPCSQCKMVPLLIDKRQSKTDAPMLDTSVSQGEEIKGETSFLSCAAPGLYEPLLTPDSKKRVAFPDHSRTDGKTVSAHTRCHLPTHSYQTPAYKSAFKRSPTAVHRPQNSSSVPKEISANTSFVNEAKVPFLKVISPAPAGEYTLDVLETGGVDSMELRQLAGTIRPVFHESCSLSDECVNGCRRPLCSLAIISPSNKQSQLLPSCSFIHTQPNFQLNKEVSCLTTHAKSGKNPHVSKCLNSDEIPNLTKSGRELPLASCNLETSPEREEALTCLVSCNNLFDDIQHNQRCNQMQQLADCEQQQQHQHSKPLSPKKLPGETASSSTVSTPPPRDLCPRRISQPLQPQTVLNYQVRPHTFPGTHVLILPTYHGSDITPVSSSDSTPVCSSDGTPVCSSDGTFLEDTSVPLCQTMRPCVKSRSQNFQMTGVTRAREIGREWRYNANEQRLLSRGGQPERRGALFFTQRSLHKDLDNPKTSGHNMQSRPPNIFSRQEHVDSSHSRYADTCDIKDSPNDGVSQFFCTTSPGNSNPVSPSTSGKDKHSQLLTSSQTLDSFTCL